MHFDGRPMAGAELILSEQFTLKRCETTDAIYSLPQTQNFNLIVLLEEANITEEPSGL